MNGMREVRIAAAALLLLPALALPGCSIKKMAINSLGNALAEAGDTYGADEDPELVAAAIPFGLKTIESLLAEAPRHEGLLYAAVSGFTQYAYAFGPPKRFGNLLVPNWATTNNGLVRYEMVSLIGSNKQPDLSLFAPPVEAGEQ